MSKTAPMTDEQSTALFYSNLAHSLPLHPFNRLYSAKFLAHIANNNINISDNPLIVHKFCGGCGITWIPGLTLCMRIKYRKKSRCTRYLELKCETCSFTTKEETLAQLHSRAKRDIPQAPKEALPTNTWGPTHSNEVKAARTTSQSTERGKKRKKNSLSAMLALKKQQALQSQLGLSSLSLLEFMK